MDLFGRFYFSVITNKYLSGHSTTQEIIRTGNRGERNPDYFGRNISRFYGGHFITSVSLEGKNLPSVPASGSVRAQVSPGVVICLHHNNWQTSPDRCLSLSRLLEVQTSKVCRPRQTSGVLPVVSRMLHWLLAPSALQKTVEISWASPRQEQHNQVLPQRCCISSYFSWLMGPTMTWEPGAELNM